MANKYGVGTKHITNEGYEVEIIEKIDYKKRIIKFKNGYEVEVPICSIATRRIKNPYHPSVYGVGCFGVGDYNARIREKITPEYTIWIGMLERCYNKYKQEKYISYVGTIVCYEWHNFQNFAKWYNDNYPRIEGIKFQLDKDLLQDGIENKVYSSSTCVFLPKRVNLFLANKQSSNTSGFVGVHLDKVNRKWAAHVSLFGEGKIKHLGRFPTPESAHEAYQSARTIESEKVKSYLRSLNYLSEEVIQLVK